MVVKYYIVDLVISSLILSRLIQNWYLDLNNTIMLKKNVTSCQSMDSENRRPE